MSNSYNPLKATSYIAVWSVPVATVPGVNVVVYFAIVKPYYNKYY